MATMPTMSTIGSRVGEYAINEKPVNEDEDIPDMPKPNYVFLQVAVPLSFCMVVLMMVSFFSPEWLFCRGAKECAFMNVGLIVACFNSYEPPRDILNLRVTNPPYIYGGLMLTDCDWVYHRVYYHVRDWLLPWWYIMCQTLALVALVTCIIGFIAILIFVIRLRTVAELNLVRLGFIMHFISFVLEFIVMITFSVKAKYDTKWMPHSRWNYYSWGFGCAVVADMFALGVFILLVKFHQNTVGLQVVYDDFDPTVQVDRFMQDVAAMGSLKASPAHSHPPSHAGSFRNIRTPGGTLPPGPAAPMRQGSHDNLLSGNNGHQTPASRGFTPQHHVPPITSTQSVPRPQNLPLNQPQPIGQPMHVSQPPQMQQPVAQPQRPMTENPYSQINRGGPTNANYYQPPPNGAGVAQQPPIVQTAPMPVTSQDDYEAVRVNAHNRRRRGSQSSGGSKRKTTMI